MARIDDAARWFKTTFGPQIVDAVGGTPFTVNLLTAIAIQETYEIWGRIFNGTMTPEEILDACVGDVISAPQRGAFPKTKDELIAAPRGQEMFDVARQALADMAKHAPEYQRYVANPQRFCHAFGVFQYDIQFFKDDPDFFLQRKWSDLGECLTRCIAELTRVTRKTFGANKQSLSDTEAAYVAIGYNQGSVNIAKGLKQGFKDDTGKYYGEYVADYLRIAANA
jgi:hypothetical protein